MILHGYSSNMFRETMESKYIQIIHPVQHLQNKLVFRTPQVKERRRIIEIPHILLEILIASGIAKTTSKTAMVHCTSCLMKFIEHPLLQVQVAWRVDTFPIDNRHKIPFSILGFLPSIVHLPLLVLFSPEYQSQIFLPSLLVKLYCNKEACWAFLLSLTWIGFFLQDYLIHMTDKDPLQLG